MTASGTEGGLDRDGIAVVSISESETDHIDQLLRRIPAVDTLLQRPALQDLTSEFGQRRVTESVRRAIENLRERIRSGVGADVSLEVLETEIITATEAAGEFSLRSVINATGVVLHTNLGRAPLAPEAVRHVGGQALSRGTLCSHGRLR